MALVVMTNILLKKIHVYSLGKLNSMESCYILISGNYKKPTSQRYFEAFFESSAIDWKDIYLLECKTTINTKHCSSQYKILNNFVYLNKFPFKFKKVECPLCLFCKSAEKTIIHLFGECLKMQYIKLRSSFQDISLSLILHRRVPFLDLQTPALEILY